MPADEPPSYANRPGGSRFKQQTLPAWKPVFTANCVIPLFFIFGVIFIPVGVVLLLESNKLREVSFTYTNCTDAAATPCSDYRLNRTFSAMAEPCVCDVQFTLTEDWTSTIYVYYRLTEFYQNHRRYLKSVNQEQLQGNNVLEGSGCTPNAFTSAGDNTILPCGMIANSKFNDTFIVRSAENNSVIAWERNSIAWTEDLEYKFGDPPSFAGTAMPAYWQQNVSSLPGQMRNEDLVVWMRTAALPKFRKLYARIPGGLEMGNYTLEVRYNYPIRRGEKELVLSTVSWIGGKNNFLGIAYMTVGGLSMLGGCLLLAIYILYGHQKKDLSKLH